jgi:hypothetical protein
MAFKHMQDSLTFSVEVPRDTSHKLVNLCHSENWDYVIDQPTQAATPSATITVTNSSSRRKGLNQASWAAATSTFLQLFFASIVITCFVEVSNGVLVNQALLLTITLYCFLGTTLYVVLKFLYIKHFIFKK